MGRSFLGALVVGLLVAPAAATAAPRSDGSVLAPARIAELVSHVPVSTFNRIGAGKVLGPQDFGVFKLHRRVTSHGKPELLTMNLAWCPHCGANNWGLAVALSRFGTVRGLRVINSGTYYCKVAHDPCILTPFPCFPYTHGLSFFGATLRSRYLSLRAIVLQDVNGHNLQRPSAREQAAYNEFDRVGETPAVDVAGRYGFLNSGFSPGAIAHKSWSQIAHSLANPRSEIAQRVDGLANLFTAAICGATAGRPGRVCRSKGVRAAGAAHLQ